MQKSLSGSPAVRVAEVSEVVLALNALSGNQGFAAAGTNAAAIEPRATSDTWTIVPALRA